jgi:hypothetical protein
MLRVMRVPRAAWILVPIASAGALTGLLLLAQGKPLALKVGRVITAGEPYAVNLHESKSVLLRAKVQHEPHVSLTTIDAEARVAGQWRSAGKLIHYNEDTRELHVLVPLETDLCRLRIGYMREPLNWRLYMALARRNVVLPRRLTPDFGRDLKQKHDTFTLPVCRPDREVSFFE